MRRGAPSANAKYGNSTAILVGDMLFGTASSIIADLGAEAVKIQAETFVRLCAGQIRDDRPTPADADRIDYYLQVLADKTGVLIATAARYGAMFSGCDATTIEIMREYGERLGMAFQLADDLIDVSSDAESLGQDARHRPARGQGDPAGPVRAGLRRPGRRQAPGAAAHRPRG